MPRPASNPTPDPHADLDGERTAELTEHPQKSRKAGGRAHGSA
jgi:hypothetical protein